MKMWHEYGSEHSMNLVMIGHFKNPDDAEKTQNLIKQLSKGLEGKVDVGASSNRFGEDVLALLREADCHILAPSELEQFLYDTSTRVEGDQIILTTDEADVSAFLKLMIMKGAKVEVYSAHDYPDGKDGQGQ